MKKMLIFLTISAFWAIVITDYRNAGLTANSGGAPIGHTGSPFDGKACSACHAGPAPAAQPGWMVANIPAEGYIPGETYTITATATRTGISRFGFQVAAFTSSGAQAGTLKSVSAETNVQSGGRYITHSSSGTAATDNAKTWVFEWVAPAAGVGTVTFYGAFLAANSNGTSSGDITLTSSLSVPQRTSTSTNFLASIQQAPVFSIYPNPVFETFTFTYRSNAADRIYLYLLDIRGRELGLLYEGDISQGINWVKVQLPDGLPSGVYTAIARTSTGVFTQKIHLI